MSFDDSGRAIGFTYSFASQQFLVSCGGHIGYSIRPSARGKGYAKEQLRLGLLEAKAKNIKKY